MAINVTFNLLKSDQLFKFSVKDFATRLPFLTETRSRNKRKYVARIGHERSGRHAWKISKIK